MNSFSMKKKTNIKEKLNFDFFVNDRICNENINFEVKIYISLTKSNFQ